MISSSMFEPCPGSLSQNFPVALSAASPRTLIADDQPDILAALHLLLKSEGYQTETVTSPAATLEAIRQDRFDLVLMDLNYARDTTSGWEGLDLLAKIRDIDRTLPVIVMTAWGSIELAVEAIRGGSGDFIQKPWDNTHLLGVVRKQLELGRELRRRQQMKTACESARVRELAAAREIQERLLPREIPRIDGCEISVIWQPAGEVGGDYFDVLKFDDHTVALCIADVMGKGLPAALLMSNVQAAVKSLATADASPDELSVRINRLVCGNVDSGKFITFFYALVDMKRRRLIYTNAGHNVPVLMRRDGSVIQLTEGGLVFGFSSASVYQTDVLELMPGDRLVLFTDGISEARNADGDEFGGERLIDLISAGRQLSAAGLQEEVFASVTAFAGGNFQDDATMVVLAID